MFDDLESNDASVGEEQAFDLLQELETNTPDRVRQQRAHALVTIKAHVTLRPGNASQLMDFKVQGVTGDISEGGLRALFPMPLYAGDIYRLEFDQAELSLPLIFAQCVRCRMLRDGAYECGFRFFTPISVPENLAVRGDVSLST